MVSAEVTSDGELSFGGHNVGRLQGFRFTPAANLDGAPAVPDDSQLAGAIAQEFEVRGNRFSEAVDSALVLANDGAIRWLGDPVAKIAPGETVLAPRALILADETLTEEARQKVQGRVDLWLGAYVKRLLGPLFELEAAVGLEGPAHNVALQLAHAQGVLERGRVAQDVKALDQNARGALRKLGVRFGAYYIYIPSLIKPAIRVLAAQLWALAQSGAGAGAGLDDISQLAASGRTSFLADSTIAREAYRVAGFRLCGDRAVRVDIVERLADLIRPAVAYRPGPNAGPPPAGAADGDGFAVTGAMMSLTGCSGEQFASVLRSLGFASQRVKGPALTVVAPAVSIDMEPGDRPEESGAAESQGALEPNGIAAEAAATDDQSSPPAPTPADSIAETPELQLPGEIAASVVNVVAEDVHSPVAEPREPPAATAPDEPVEIPEEALIEVWRPRPPPHRPRRQRSGPGHSASVRPTGGEGDRQGVEDRPKHRRHRTSTPPQAPGEAGSPPSQGVQAREDNRRPPHRRGPPRSFDVADKSETSADRRGGPHKPRDRDERKPDDRRRENAPAPPARREPPIDLNSPFAKLLALKSQLEAKGKN